MKCRSCESENAEAAKFCIECGHNLGFPSMDTIDVSSLEEKLERLRRYVPRAIAEKILAQKDRIEGERRQATIMFCDMCGYTPLTEKLGPEETFSLMDQVFEILIHKVHEYEGTVNELRGDGMLALFGAPLALEDAPQRGIRSALAIHREMKQFNETIRGDSPIPPILLRIGINTGPVVVGAVGNDLRVQFTAVGDTINMAARMEGLAEPGTTYVTKETFELTKGLFQFETLGEREVKGKERAVPVYKVLSSRPDVYRPRLGSERMIYSDMVGRDKELDRLELQVMKAVNGDGSVVNVVGEAGIGKSRLVAELKKREVVKRVNLLEGRAISMGRNLSFHPVIDVLKQWARIGENDGEAEALGKLEKAVRRVCREDVLEVLPFVATLMGMNLSGRYAERVKGIEGEALEKLILKNMRDLLTRATERRPLVIVVDDLHWADTTSIALLESLFRLAEKHRILFINVFRPGHRETGDRITKTTKEKLPVYYLEIALEPLDYRMSEALITNMLNVRGLHHSVVEQIVERAGGNPFFIEEVVRSFIDEGAVALKDGTFETTDRFGKMAVPNTINDVLMARIDRLEDKTRNLVKLASVIGRNFFYRILADMATAIEDIDGRLSYLKEVQLIRERRRMDELEYLFKHALVQEAAYESITLRKRKEMHLRVARSIEKVFGHRLNEFYGMLSYHYSKAEDMEKLEEYLMKAGEEALKSSASAEALHYYQEALSIYLRKYGDQADPEKIAMFHKNIALAFYNKGENDEAVEYFEKALDYYWGKLPKHSILKIFKLLSAVLHLLISLYLPSLKFRKIPTQKDTEIFDLLYKKNAALAIIESKRFLFEFLYTIQPLTSFNLTKFKLGLEVFVGASTIFSFSGVSFRLSRKTLDFVKDKIDEHDIKIFAAYEVWELLYNYLKGNWKAIKEYNEELVKKILDVGEIYLASHHCHWHGYTKLYQGYLDISESMINKLEHIYEIYENDNALNFKQLLKTGLLMERRKLNDALIEIDEGIEFGQRTGQGLVLIHMFSCKARIHLLMDDIEEAKKWLDRADGLRSEFKPVPWQLSNFLRSRICYDLYKLKEATRKGNTSEIIEYKKKAFKSGKMLLSQTRKVAQHRTEAYRVMGIYYWLIKRQKKALEWWSRSIEEGERLGARLALSRTYFEVGKRLLEPESNYKELNGIEAEAYLKKARVLFEEMDLQWDLDQLAEVVRG